MPRAIPLLLLAAALTPALAQTPPKALESCLARAATPWPMHDPSTWTSHIQLTVSPFADASRISFDPIGLQRVSYLVPGVLRFLTFKPECIGLTFKIRLEWRPSPNLGTITARGNTLIVSHYAPREEAGDRILLFDEQIEALRTAPSMREFLRDHTVWGEEIPPFRYW